MNIQKRDNIISVSESYISYPRLALTFTSFLGVLGSCALHFEAHILSKTSFYLFLIIMFIGLASIPTKIFTFIDFEKKSSFKRFLYFLACLHTVFDGIKTILQKALGIFER